ncbi:MAG: hypothetical protein KAW94_01065 [Candidatus Thorarchaeota archaeon]|nr:hypothetical protein [Candidatus Thorarchaeota archaeon]
MADIVNELNSEIPLETDESERERLDSKRIQLTSEIRSTTKLYDVLFSSPAVLLKGVKEKDFHLAYAYCMLVERLDRGEIVIYRKFARENNVSSTSVSKWGSEKTKPSLVKALEKNGIHESQELSHTRKPLNETPLFSKDCGFLLEAYENQYYYFSDPEPVSRLLKHAVCNSNLDGNPIKAYKHIVSLMDATSSERPMKRMKDGRFRIGGNAMRILCELSHISLKDLEGQVARITGANSHGGIFNPKFPVGEDLKAVVAGIMGVVVSDCHVRKSGSIAYYESNPERIEMFRQLLSRFGNIRWDGELKLVNGTHELWIPAPIADIVRFSGIPSGDRTILNYGLPSEIQYWSNAAICEYMKNMLAQEGNVNRNGRIVWGRTNAIHAGKKTDTYCFKSCISEEALDFLKNSDELKTMKSEETRERYITISHLKYCKEKDDKTHSRIAGELLEVIDENRNRLIDDEVNLLRKLEFEVRLGPRRISYHENSERVTISWTAMVNSISSRIMAALIISPKHPEKSRRLDNWLQTRPTASVEQIRKKLRLKGYNS